MGEVSERSPTRDKELQEDQQHLSWLSGVAHPELEHWMSPHCKSSTVTISGKEFASPKSDYLTYINTNTILQHINLKKMHCLTTDMYQLCMSQEVLHVAIEMQLGVVPDVQELFFSEWASCSLESVQMNWPYGEDPVVSAFPMELESLQKPEF